MRTKATKSSDRTRPIAILRTRVLKLTARLSRCRRPEGST